MAKNKKDIPPTETPVVENQLEEGTYEIIRKRLETQGQELKSRLEKLNASRKAVFGSIETKLIATERISTAHNCVPRDIFPIGEHLLVGYNVHMGLKATTQIEDVFSIYLYKEHTFHESNFTLLKHATFAEDFLNLYKYYRDTRFVKFAVIGVHLHMVFQIGKSIDDIKTFKWRIAGDTLEYIDNRSDHEFVFPPQHEFDWKRTTREQHRYGAHPHISIDDRVFVEAIGGDLTIKVEDNTDTGKGILAEPVDVADQSLDDAEVLYALVGNLILIKIKPYKEPDFRYFVYNEKVQTALRIDAISGSCILLPDDQGLIFANGYYLQTGEYKLFESRLENMLFEKRVQSKNGEDFLYVFYNKPLGVYIMLSYNIIEQQVELPVICHGYSLYENGEMLYFKGDDEPQKHHAIQIWQTSFLGPDFDAPTKEDSYLTKIGNKDLVRAMAESQEIIKLVRKEDIYGSLYLDLFKKSTDILDSYHWLTHTDAENLAEPITAIRSASNTAIEEFEKVVAVKKRTLEETTLIEESVRELLREFKRRQYQNIDDFVTLLTDLRVARGQVITLRDLRYINLGLVDSLEEQVIQTTDTLSQNCVKFLLKKDALKSYDDRIIAIRQEVEAAKKVAETKQLEEKVNTTSKELELLIDVVSNLKIEDATHTTRIIDNISAIYSTFNQINAVLKQKRKELFMVEGKAEFNAQLKLINQGTINYLDVSDSPEKCDEYLNKLMVQLEELEGKFAEFDEFISIVSEKREEVYNAFESRKVSLVEARNNKASALFGSGERILKGITNRIATFTTVPEINGYFAGDLLVGKVRDLIEQLTQLGDSAKADSLQSALKLSQEDASRQLKDKQELFVGGKDIIQLGQHRFLTNSQDLDLTLVLKDDQMHYHLTGTGFFEAIDDPDFQATKPVWNQVLVSENKTVYRAEYLAYQLLQQAVQPGRKGLTISGLLAMTDVDLFAHVQAASATRLNEGYIKGVHDKDAAQLLKTLAFLHQSAGLLRYPSEARAAALLFWQSFAGESEKTLMTNRLKGMGAIIDLFPGTGAFADIMAEIQQMITGFNEATRLFDPTDISEAGEYLFYVVTHNDQFVLSHQTGELIEQFNGFIAKNKARQNFDASITALEENPVAQYKLIRKWLLAFVEEQGSAHEAEVAEAAALMQTKRFNKQNVIHSATTKVLDGLLGSHNSIEQSKITVDYHQLTSNLRHFEAETVPAYGRYVQLKKDLVHTYKDELQLDSFKPKVMSSFVRNRLIDEVYLPVIGGNLAKQMGTAGAQKRTDLMGLLLLVSPPGYGKTTLMEYIANRLGLAFMKINGPSIGHSVIALDPENAPNAAAKDELEKLNLALEMGDNVLLYLDDIQHCNPEFLQKFISLCDAQRKIEGVFKGRSKTYDLRGKRFAVAMAGNPYTESGEKFQIPDMLANRADIYNLGDIIGDKGDAFKMSYIENSVTSNAALSKLVAKSRKDLNTMVKWAITGSKDGLDFEASYAAEETNEYISVIEKLIKVRDVVFEVNQQYIYSAAQGDAYRTEPPFRLQGSYRNMNKIAAKIVAIMNEKELKSVLMSHYEGECQTLTNDSEANLLKFKELMGWLTKKEEERWNAIKATFVKNQKTKGMGADKQVGQVLEQMEHISTGLSRIGDALTNDDENDITPNPADFSDH